ncbi:MAG: chorismate lyase, partial [Thiohalobacterales bacterium]
RNTLRYCALPAAPREGREPVLLNSGIRHAIIPPAHDVHTATLKMPDQQGLQPTRWYPHRHYPRSGIPADLAGWLLDPASLTRRLLQLCPDAFRVRLLSQQWGRPRADEAQALGMRYDGQAIIRQVQLLCDDSPWVYARTVIPATSMRGKLKRLAHLGTRPLGAMLFADPGMRRGIVELARITRGQQLYVDALQRPGKHTDAVWGRRSVFRITGKPLLVSEIFLPGFPAQSAVRPLWKAGQ